MSTSGWGGSVRPVSQSRQLLAAPPAGDLWGLVALFSAAMSGVVLAYSHPGYVSMSGPEPSPALLYFMQALSLLLVPSFLCRLGGLRRVLGQRQLPQEIWPRCLRRSLQRVGAAWLLLSLPLMLEAGLLHDGARLLAGPAWLGLSLCICLWVYAAWQGLVARGGLLLLPALLALASFQGLDTLWPAWVPAGTPLHLAGWAALPLSLWALQRRLAGHLRAHSPTGAAGSSSPAQQLQALWHRQQQRWTRLDGQRSTALLLIAPQMLFTILHVNSGAGSFLIVPSWGSDLDLWHGVRLLFLAVASLGLLRLRDLHWRRLLAPQAPLRRNLALKLARDSGLPLAVGVLLIQLCCSLLLSQRGPGGWILALQQGAAVGLPLLCDLSLALMFVLLLRARFSSSTIGVALLTAMLACAALAWGWDGMPGLQRGWISSLAELALALGLLAGARVAWRNADLQALLRSSQQPARTGWGED